MNLEKEGEVGATGWKRGIGLDGGSEAETEVEVGKGEEEIGEGEMSAVESCLPSATEGCFVSSDGRETV